METTGVYEPETIGEAQEAYREAGPAAKVVVRETASAMEFDSAEYESRVTSDVVETARDALFASLLVVRIGSREEFEEWCGERPSYDSRLVGGENVDRVVWHAAPFAKRVVAATFQDAREAAIATVRRHAFGEIYRNRL